jgi:hypothetical protein
MQNFSHISGWVGMVLIIIAYFLVSTKKIKPTSKKYQLLNLLGAIGVGINAYYENATPAFVLQIVWGFIAIVSIYKSFKKRY